MIIIGADYTRASNKLRLNEAASRRTLSRV
jgi:hypothetical protein